MKKLLFILLLMGMQFPLLYAQNENSQAPGGPGRHQPKDRVSRLKEELNLTDDQAKKLETIFSDQQKQRETLLQKQKEEMEKFRKEMDAMSENSEKEILTVLTDEQKAEYNSFREERNNGRRNMPPPMGQMNQQPPMQQMGGQPMGQMNQQPPMQQMGGQPMGQMNQQPPMQQMGQFGGPGMGQQQMGGFMPGQMMPPPPQGDMKEGQNQQQDSKTSVKGKKTGKKFTAPAAGKNN